MSVTSEIQQAARAIRQHQSSEATLHRELAGLLDRIALTTPASVIESQAGPIVRQALRVARAYINPTAVLGDEVHGHDQGVPVRTLTGEKSCGCFITDVCDCADFTSSGTWGWTR